jgi:endonuclease G
MIIRTGIVAAAEKRSPLEIRSQEPPMLNAAAELLKSSAVEVPTKAREDSLAMRAANLGFAGARPSTTELERLIGNNDMVDEFYLQRALVAARPVMRIIIRDAAGRERGWATGLMVSPRLLLTNWHVFPTRDETRNSIAEAHYVLDIAGNPAPSYRFAVRGDIFYTSNQELDFSLVAVDPTAVDGEKTLAQFGYHRLIAEPNKVREGEAMTLIQHPGGERRQFAIRENQLIQIQDKFLWYQSDTAPGSSGAPVFNDSFQVVALHHSGAAKRDEQGRYVLRDGRTVISLDGIDDSSVQWVANEGLRISVLCAFLSASLHPDNAFASELFQAMQGGDVMSNIIRANEMQPRPSDTEREIAASPFSLNGNLLTIPLQLQVSLSMSGATSPPRAQVGPVAAAFSATQAAATVGVEALRYPIVDRDYSSRRGYDTNFLNVSAPLPTVNDTNIVSKMENGAYEIPYEHFTIVVNKERRLPLFTASNVDYSVTKRRPEPGDYSRDGLTGLGPNDQEKWFTDPRIPQQDQLPDVFYTKDRGSFDKGHVVRRDDMCWGDSRDQIVRANGDTFHVTNCTPQVAGFNRSANGEDNWGDLENEIQKQGNAEKLSILAGAILSNDDKFFEGKDDFGPVKIQIPKEFWKVVLANKNGQLAAYAFILKQDLQNVPLEFRVTATWNPYLVSLAHLESQLSGFVFAEELRKADQSPTDGQELADALGIGLHPSVTPQDPAPPGDI